MIHKWDTFAINVGIFHQVCTVRAQRVMKKCAESPFYERALSLYDSLVNSTDVLSSRAFVFLLNKIMLTLRGHRVPSHAPLLHGIVKKLRGRLSVCFSRKPLSIAWYSPAHNAQSIQQTRQMVARVNYPASWGICTSNCAIETWLI